MKESSTKTSKAMDAVQAPIALFLKAKGYRRQNRTFNHTTSDGLVQVINFQMGSYPIGMQYVIPGLRENLYGKFTVNLGIFVPECFQAYSNEILPKSIKEYHCHLRARFSELASAREDWWWDLSRKPKLISGDIISHLNEYGFPFLERFSTRKAVVDDWIAFSSEKGLSCRPMLDVAIILNHLGRKNEAREIFEKHKNNSKHQGHLEFLRTIAQKLNLE